MIVIALSLGFAVACFAALAVSMSRGPQVDPRPAPRPDLRVRLHPQAPFVPQQRNGRTQSGRPQTVVTQVHTPTPAQMPAHDRYAEVQALRASRTRRPVRLEL